MVSEQIDVAVSARVAYEALASVRFARWSPECFAVWVWRRRDGRPARFIGWNRRGPFVWFTTCTVTASVPGEEFTFDVTTFGLPVARWTYSFAPQAGGGTTVTEEWTDRRGRGAWLLGRIFTGSATKHRPEVNRDGMRETLRRLKAELETGRP
ncbi:MAG TPA: SRPBCC family protein [Candidatus Limnocylindrales bacterium]